MIVLASIRRKLIKDQPARVDVYNLDLFCFCLGRGGVGVGLERYLLCSNHFRDGQWCQVPIAPFDAG